MAQMIGIHRLFPYGNSFQLDCDGIRIMVNGRMYKFARDYIGQTWQKSGFKFGCWDNFWRKEKKPCP